MTAERGITLHCDALGCPARYTWKTSLVRVVREQAALIGWQTERRAYDDGHDGGPKERTYDRCPAHSKAKR